METQGKSRLGHLLFKAVLETKSFLRTFHKHPSPGEAKELLIVASTFLGDMIMTLPLVAAVCRRYPRANITLLVRKEYVALAEKVKGVLRVIPEPVAYAELRKIRALVPNHFDIAFVAFETRHLPLMAALDVGEIVSFDDPKGRRSDLIDRKIPFPTDRPESTHQSWLSLRLLEGRPQCPGLRPPYLDLSTIPEPRKISRPYVVMHIGARSPVRQWLPERYAQVVVALHQRGVETVLTGAHDDASLSTRLTGLLPSPGPCSARTQAFFTSPRRSVFRWLCLWAKDRMIYTATPARCSGQDNISMCRHYHVVTSTACTAIRHLG